ncbi:hypothetical protein N0V88_007633 [Collariella sp. IMI 366227]|nr:hypothetical protein N0V88_007633 [Collariella sp. IMI 366227]
MFSASPLRPWSRPSSNKNGDVFTAIGPETDLSATSKQPVARVTELTDAFKHPMNRLAYLNKLSKGARKSQQLGAIWTSELAQLPTISFSELLRSLDPIETWGAEADPTDGIHVGPGMAQLTPLGQEIDMWGVRKKYRSDTYPLSDYKILLRCAGAACDFSVMGEIWKMMDETGMRDLDPQSNFELAKARFLAEPLYSQYDLARLRVRPINLHMMKTFIMSIKGRQYLKILGHNILGRQRHMFGFNRHSLEHAEHLTRILRQEKPPFRLFTVAVRLCYILDTEGLCALMVGLARCGSLKVVHDILGRYWGVQIMQAMAYAPDSSLRPTQKLLETIVHCFCTNAEFATAIRVLDTASNAYRIRIAEETWFQLLEWAYVLCSKPASTEWKILKRQFRGTKGVKPNAVDMIWNTMTAAPYHIQPGFDQYLLLAGGLISQNNIAKALDVMLELEPMYRQLQAEHEASFSKHAASSALGVDVPQTEMAWRQARARKLAAHYKLQLLCRKILKRVGKSSAGEHITVRGVPQFIQAFRDLLPDNVEYPIATGMVKIAYTPPFRRLERAMVKFTQLPALTADVNIVGRLKKPRPKKIEEQRMVPAPHLSLHGFLTQRPDWVRVQRESLARNVGPL